MKEPTSMKKILLKLAATTAVNSLHAQTIMFENPGQGEPMKNQFTPSVLWKILSRRSGRSF